MRNARMVMSVTRTSGAPKKLRGLPPPLRVITNEIIHLMRGAAAPARPLLRVKTSEIIHLMRGLPFRSAYLVTPAFVTVGVRSAKPVQAKPVGFAPAFVTGGRAGGKAPASA